MSDRDHDLEREILGAAGVRPEYSRQVLARLDHFEVDNGGNLDGWDQDVDSLLVEAGEEAADITGWLIGAALQMGPEHRLAIEEVVQHAAAAHRALEELRLEVARRA